MMMAKITGVLAGFGVILMNKIPEVLALGSAYCGDSGSSDNPKVDTALGCVPVRIDSFVEWLLPYLFGIAGGISFLLMVYGFVLLTMSGGDSKLVQGAKETIMSAIMGLFVSAFSLFILRLITVNILHIPGIN